VVAEAREFISRAKWQFAWSMRFLPHEYTLREWHQEAGTEDAYNRMVQAIREHGYDDQFGRKRTIRYLRIDGWRYWVMSPPDRPLPEVLERTTLINRAEVDENGRPSKGPRWLKEGVAQTRMEVER
jgi:hypothetical protein